MRKYISLFLFVIALPIVAQQLPVENIYFSPDREDYKQSDSILIRGQIVSNDSLGTPFSRYLDMELWNSEDSLIVHQKLRCNDDGRFTTLLQVPFDTESGVYYLRAYTRLMLNYPLTTLPIERIYVGRVKNDDDAPDLSELRCAFYPEGGHTRCDIAQGIGVRLLSKNGKAVRMAYYICDEHGDTLRTDTTTHSGWQRFMITQKKGKLYFLCVENNFGELQRFALPEPDDKPVITSQVNRCQLVYHIYAAEDERKSLSLYFYHPNLGLQLMPVTPETGVITLDDMQEGMLSLLLVDKEKNIVSQTFQYIDKKGVKKT